MVTEIRSLSSPCPGCLDYRTRHRGRHARPASVPGAAISVDRALQHCGGLLTITQGESSFDAKTRRAVEGVVRSPASARCPQGDTHVADGLRLLSFSRSDAAPVLK